MPRVTRKTKLRDLIEQRGWRRIGEAEWKEIRLAIPEIVPEDLQVPEIQTDPPWSGVRQHTLEELELSLGGLSDVYASREDLQRFCRTLVIRAKDRARWASRNSRLDETRRSLKAEMVEWMLVWLGDPALFPAWVKIRTQTIRTAHSAAP